jgi:DNA adenine methylase
MQYFGGKARIAKRLAEYINPLIGDKDYYEPFCGSCNVTQHIVAKKRFASDAHKELIALHKHVQAGGWVPELVTEDDYRRARVTNDFEDWYRGFVGFGCSYSGKWFGGYARGGVDRNYASNAKNTLIKKHRLLGDVSFSCSTYKEVVPTTPSLIYCDIPYKETTGYSEEFSHEEFYG